MNSAQMIHEFIQKHPLGVVGMVDLNGESWASAMYAASDKHLNIYFTTKEDTAKHKYLTKNPNVSVVYVDESSQTTVQAQGVAQLVKDSIEAENAEESLTSIVRSGGEWMTPLAKLDAGNYKLYKIEVAYARMSSFSGKVMREGANIIEYRKDS